MDSVPYQSLLPIFAFFGVGVALRAAGIASRDQAGFLFRLVLNVTLPALVFLSVAQAELTARTALLPLTGFMVDLACALAALLYARMAGLDPRTTGTLVLGAAITNMLFSFPFILATLGRSALADAILYDLGNAVFFATVAYSTALRYGGSGGATVTTTLLKTLRAPIFLAIAAAVALNVLGAPVPQVAERILSPLAAATAPLVLIAVGIIFSASHLLGRLSFVTLLLRMPLGFVCGACLAWISGFEGPTAAVIAVSAAAPIGFNSVTLASIGGLDTDQCASALSLSIAVGLVSTAALLLLASRWLGT